MLFKCPIVKINFNDDPLWTKKTENFKGYFNGKTIWKIYKIQDSSILNLIFCFVLYITFHSKLFFRIHQKENCIDNKPFETDSECSMCIVEPNRFK